MMKYIAAVLAFFFLLFLVKEGYQSTNKTGANSTRLSCHTESVVFERVYTPSLLKAAQSSLEAGEYELSSRVKKAHYMESRLFEYVDIKEVDQVVKDTIATYRNVATKNNDRVSVDYIIYENDKGDPGKKTPKSKLYAGYLYFEIMLNGEKVYVIQIDFNDSQGLDIPKRVACAIKSIMTAS
jgi:hypothetical protein